jgi:catechol 2,3-dioxygenase-like lactoylglutathione lyase family enzyme
MLDNSRFFAGVAVSNREKSREFYEGVLGLKPASKNLRADVYETGGGRIMVYESPASAGSGKATLGAWDIPTDEDLAKTVQDMKAKGVEFLTYDIPGATWQDDIATMDEIKIAWFKDPDGNIFSMGTPSRNLPEA